MRGFSFGRTRFGGWAGRGAPHSGEKARRLFAARINQLYELTSSTINLYRGSGLRAVTASSRPGANCLAVPLGNSQSRWMIRVKATAVTAVFLNAR